MKGRFRLLSDQLMPSNSPPALQWRITKIHGIRLRGFEVLAADRMWGTIEGLTRLFSIFGRLLLFYVYLPLLLSLFPATANLAPRLYGYVLRPLSHVARAIGDFIPNLFFIAIAIAVTRYLLKFIRLFFGEVERGSLHFKGFHAEWAQPTYKLVRILVFALSLVVVFPYLPGAGSPAFQGVSVFLGILFSFGSSSAVGNMVAGIVLTYMRPFHIGDRVKIADTIGDILEKNLLATRIRTIKNVEITIPNSMVLGSHILNYSAAAKNEGLIVHTTVTIGYDAPWASVQRLLVSAALKTEHVLKDPSPFVLQTSLDDFYVSYKLNAYTRHAGAMAVITSDLHRYIQTEFHEHGVEIMSPHYNALRDGNRAAIPAELQPSGYEPATFRFSAAGPAKN